MESIPGVRVPALNRGESLDDRSEAALGVTDSSPPDFGDDGNGGELRRRHGEEGDTSELNDTAQDQGTSLPDEQQRSVRREAPAAVREQDKPVDWQQVCSEVGTSRWCDIS